MDKVIDLIDRSLAPPEDPVFVYLMEQALIGHVPVFGVVMSPSRLRRAHDDFHPERESPGSEIVTSIGKRWNAGESFQMWVYPRGSDVIVADDYLVLAGIERGKPSSIAVQMLGQPYGDGISSVVGPIPVEQVREYLNSPAIRRI